MPIQIHLEKGACAAGTLSLVYQSLKIQERPIFRLHARPLPDSVDRNFALMIIHINV
jgi:hypothetical protein